MSAQPCEACGAPRTGVDAGMFRRRAGITQAVCRGCKATRSLRCPRKVGPEGRFGPRCVYGPGHAGDCQAASLTNLSHLVRHPGEVPA